MDQLDSIRCAAQIQEELLPRLEQFNAQGFFASSDLILLPKHIVTGDSLWMQEAGDKLLFAVIDCTGHGVPAALLSIMCHVQLNIAVNHFGLSTPAEILTKVNELVKGFLGDGKKATLGMDIGLCCLDRRTKRLTFCGAKRPLTILRSINTGSFSKKAGYDRVRPTSDLYLYEWKGQNDAVGSEVGTYYLERSIQLLQGDRLFLFSDGVVDQFGGEFNKKLLSKRLRKLLTESGKLSLARQTESIRCFISAWKADNEQTDDITLFAAEI